MSLSYYFSIPTQENSIFSEGPRFLLMPFPTDKQSFRGGSRVRSDGMHKPTNRGPTEGLKNPEGILACPSPNRNLWECWGAGEGGKLILSVGLQTLAEIALENADIRFG